jgi:hypothetical protein
MLRPSEHCGDELNYRYTSPHIKSRGKNCGACRIHEDDQKCLYNFSRDEIGSSGKIILIWSLNEQGARVWIKFIRLRVHCQGPTNIAMSLSGSIRWLTISTAWEIPPPCIMELLKAKRWSISENDSCEISTCYGLKFNTFILKWDTLAIPYINC